jgi:hypothetical protein
LYDVPEASRGDVVDRTRDVVRRPEDVEVRAAASLLLRAAGTLAAIADELDDLRGQPLDEDRRDRRDFLLRQQRRARASYEEALRRFRRARPPKAG